MTIKKLLVYILSFSQILIVESLICHAIFFLIKQSFHVKTEQLYYKHIKEMGGGEWDCYRSLRGKQSEDKKTGKKYDHWDYYYVAPKGSKYINKLQPPAKKHVFRLVSYYYVLVE